MTRRANGRTTDGDRPSARRTGGVGRDELCDVREIRYKPRGLHQQRRLRRQISVVDCKAFWCRAEVSPVELRLNGYDPRWELDETARARGFSLDKDYGIWFKSFIPAKDFDCNRTHRCPPARPRKGRPENAITTASSSAARRQFRCSIRGSSTSDHCTHCPTRPTSKPMTR